MWSIKLMFVIHIEWDNHNMDKVIKYSSHSFNLFYHQNSVFEHYKLLIVLKNIRNKVTRRSCSNVVMHLYSSITAEYSHLLTSHLIHNHMQDKYKYTLCRMNTSCREQINAKQIQEQKRTSSKPGMSSLWTHQATK